jgi:hypothetical protein
MRKNKTKVNTQFRSLPLVPALTLNLFGTGYHFCHQKTFSKIVADLYEVGSVHCMQRLGNVEENVLVIRR